MMGNHRQRDKFVSSGDEPDLTLPIRKPPPRLITALYIILGKMTPDADEIHRRISAGAKYVLPQLSHSRMLNLAAIMRTIPGLRDGYTARSSGCEKGPSPIFHIIIPTTGRYSLRAIYFAHFECQLSDISFKQRDAL